jgi:hypothetical protein
MFGQWDRLGRRLPFERPDRYPCEFLWVYDARHGLCLAKTSYTYRMNDLPQSSSSLVRTVPIRFCHDRVAPASPRVDGQRFPFPRGPRPRKPGSASAIAGFTRATTSPSIDRSAQAVLGCVANLLVRVEEASHLGYS